MKAQGKGEITHNWIQRDGRIIPSGTIGEILEKFPVETSQGKVWGYRLKFNDGTIDWGTSVRRKK